MRKLKEILDELEAHPNVAYFKLFTFNEAIEYYKEELESQFLREGYIYDFSKLDYDYTDLTKKQKYYISELKAWQHFDIMFKYYTEYSLSFFGSIDELPDLKKAMLNEVKLNAILTENKDEVDDKKN